jgi:hypothetical protein
MMSTTSKPLDISFLAPSAVNWRPQQLILPLHPNEPDEVPIEVDVMKFISSNPNEGLKRNPAMVPSTCKFICTYKFAHLQCHDAGYELE